MFLVTTQCERHGHPEFYLEADEACVPDVYLQHVVQTVEGMVASGSVFRPGQSFQIGWMWTEIRQLDETFLTICEPDMRTMPVAWVPGLTETLRTMMLQLFMLDSVGLRDQMDIPHMRQAVNICRRYVEPNFRMDRLPADGDSDSGWFVSCTDDRHDHGRPENVDCVSIYEAFLHQRGIQRFVSFPVGSVIVSDQRRRVELFLHGRPLKVLPGSFLDRWESSRR